MNQKEYTGYVMPRLLEAFPHFVEHCTVKPDDIVDIDYRSPGDKLTLWVTTQNCEITVGFNQDANCEWHTHMSLFGADTPDEELEVAINLIRDIVTDAITITHSSHSGYIPSYGSDIDEPSVADEVRQAFKWSEL